MTDSAKWIIDEESENEAKEKIRDKQDALKKWESYVRDVSNNPFYSSTLYKIKKLKGSSYPEGTYRYRKDPLRVIYFPEKSSQTVYTLDAATADSASYKIRSKK